VSLAAEVLLLFAAGSNHSLIDLALNLLVNAYFLGLLSAIQVAWYVMITARKAKLSATSEPNQLTPTSREL